MSLLSLILKKGDRILLKYYRPLSLTNVDYKILAFVLTLRIQKIIHNDISCDQTGYIRKRFIGTMLGFQKALDSIEWPFFMFEVLREFNFGEQLF